MRRAILLFFLFSESLLWAQLDFPEKIQRTNLAKLKTGDSIVYYQASCYQSVVDPVNGSVRIIYHRDSITAPNHIVTEKFLVIKKDSGYFLKYFVSPLDLYPNKKFTALRFYESKKWMFTNKFNGYLSREDVLRLALAEYSMQETMTEQEKVTMKNSPQLIVAGIYFPRQGIVPANAVLARQLNCLTGMKP